MATKDPGKRRLSKRRYLDRLKAAKYGPEAVGKDMRGRHGNHARGKDNGRWNDGQLLSSHGYVMVRVGKDHPRAFGNGYAYQHDLVMEAHLGRSLEAGEVVHHRNEIKTDNRVENLELLTGSTHMMLHDAERERDSRGRFVREFPAAAGSVPAPVTVEE